MSKQRSSVRIELEYSKAISVASNRANGRECYQKQMRNIIENNLDKETDFVVVFPDNIQLVSSSYLLGMFEKIYNLIGIQGIVDRVYFEDKTEIDLKQRLIKGIRFSSY